MWWWCERCGSPPKTDRAVAIFPATVRKVIRGRPTARIAMDALPACDRNSVQPCLMALRDPRPRDERMTAQASQSSDRRAMQHEEFDQRRRDHHPAKEHGGSASEPRDDEQCRAGDLDCARHVTKPLPHTDVAKERHHVGTPDELRAADQKKHAREGELQELEHQDAMPQLGPYRRPSLVPSAECAPRQPFPNQVEGEEQRNEDE